MLGRFVVLPDLTALFVISVVRYFPDPLDPKAPRAPVNFEIDLQLTLEGGSALSRSTEKAFLDTVEPRGSIFRVEPSLSANLYLNGVASYLGIKSLELSSGAKWHYLPTEAGSPTKTFISEAAIFKFTDSVSINLTYQNGAQAPNFVRSEKFGVSQRRCLRMGFASGSYPSYEFRLNSNNSYPASQRVVANCNSRNRQLKI